MTELFFGLTNLMADVAPEPVRSVASRGGYYVAGLAFAVAIAVAGVILVRRGRGKR